MVFISDCMQCLFLKRSHSQTVYHLTRKKTPNMGRNAEASSTNFCQWCQSCFCGLTWFLHRAMHTMMGYVIET